MCEQSTVPSREQMPDLSGYPDGRGRRGFSGEEEKEGTKYDCKSLLTELEKTEVAGTKGHLGGIVQQVIREEYEGLQE